MRHKNMSLQEELDMSRKALGFGLLCALVTVYGGVTLSYGEGTWFYQSFEFESTDNSNFEIEGTAFYKIDEIESEMKATLNGDKSSDDETFEYDSDGFEEREDVMKFTKNLALLSILLVGGLLAIAMGLFTGQFENPKQYLDYSKNICLGLIAVCLFNAGHFAMTYPEAWQDDTSDSLVDDCGLDSADDTPFLALFIGRCDNKNTHEAFDGYTGDYAGTWHPGPAWFITFALIPAITTSEYLRLKRIEESNALVEYKHSKKQKPPRQMIAETLTVPAVPEPETPAPPAFKRKEPKVKTISCPDCGEHIYVKMTGKHQDIKCPKCGTEGEVTF